MTYRNAKPRSLTPDSWRLAIGATVTHDGTSFCVWAPTARRVEVVVFQDGHESSRHAMRRDERGYWMTHVAGIGAGTRYAYSVDDGPPRPDPASRSQPDGVHAPSEIVDPAGFVWHDSDWRGRPLEDLIIYELHVGTATPGGTFDSLIEKLPYFVDLGVTALEIMPVADFPGRRNWGYDGVDLYAPANAYGGPEAFKRLIDAAHRHGLAIILDVVYNHFGPDGNYLHSYSPAYFTDRHHTPWGAALNLDGPGCAAVRRFLIDNACYWAHEYHIDGLRLDATHALIDDSSKHFLQELAESVRATLPADRHFVITAEDERNLARMALPATQGGYGLDALWADDFHHAARIALTGEQHGYYADYSGSIAELVTTIRDGWLYQGQTSTAAGHPRGTSPLALRYPQFIYCIQNHDQIGNRPLGDRLNHLVDRASYRALSALLLLLPQTPLLFQGQEWAASSPFLFFTDHHAELGRLVTEGRRREFAYFHTTTGIEVPDPQDRATFERSKLRWDEIGESPHRETLALYRDLIRLRTTHPALRHRDRAALSVNQIGDRSFIIQRDGDESAQTLWIVVNLGARAAIPLDSRARSILLDTNDPRYGGDAPAMLSSSTDVTQMQMNARGVVVVGVA